MAVLRAKNGIKSENRQQMGGMVVMVVMVVVVVVVMVAI